MAQLNFSSSKSFLPNFGNFLQNDLAANLFKKLSGLGAGVRWPPAGLG